MTEEEKMARRVLACHGLMPPFDLEELVSHYASVERLSFPILADGITIGLGGKEKPRVLINCDRPATRLQFTLAHELGHIIIPWHTGLIVSHIEADALDDDYRQLESEANRFAAELLMPTDWLKRSFSPGCDFAATMEKCLRDTGVSRDALLIKVFNVISIPVLCLQVDISGNVIRRYSSGPVPSGANIENVNDNSEELASIPANEIAFSLGDRNYKAWVFHPLVIDDQDPRPWRDILDQILSDTGLQDMLASINAILPVQLQRNKEKNIEEICALVFASYSKRDNIRAAVMHPLFEQYVIKRVKELKLRS